MATAWILCHVPFEGPGAIGPLLEKRGFELQTLNCWTSPTFPDVEEVSFVVVMGGPMSVNDTKEHPWLVPERQWILTMLQAGVPVLGVCLGAQLMSAALGGSVGRNPEREIGWWPLEAVHEQGRTVTVLHWHGETFSLPEGAVWLEKSEACAHQSFRWGERAIGLQYHLEATKASLDSLVENCRDELLPSPYVQSEQEIREGWDAYHADALAALEELLDDLCRT